MTTCFSLMMKMKSNHEVRHIRVSNTITNVILTGISAAQSLIHK